MGVPPANEDVPFRFSPNAYKPPPEDEMDFSDLPRKKKMFSSSSFYEEPNAIYPTVEEQVELCRKIADSLSDDSNKKSKGANMFFKRVKRAEKWVVESIGTANDSDYYEPSRGESVATPDPSKAPYVRVSKGPPQLKLILDPRHLLDMKRLRQEGINIVEHNAVSPEICLDLVKDLNSPTGRGAQLFAKRKKKSEEWVVDEEKVRQLLRERETGYTSSPEPPTTVPCGGGVEPLVFPRVQMVKTPWAAAMESPFGSCAGAFRDVHPNEVAESVIRAAETKVMTYPAPVKPVIEPVIQPESNVQLQNYPSTVFTPAPTPFTPVASQQAPKWPLSTSSFKAGVYTADPYKPRAPRGWTGTSSGGSQYISIQPNLPAAVQEPVQPQIQLQPQPQPQKAPVQGPIPAVPSYKLTHQPSVMKSYSFANFNKSPRSWNEAASGFQNVHIKPVKPPSVLVQ